MSWCSPSGLVDARLTLTVLSGAAPGEVRDPGSIAWLAQAVRRLSSHMRMLDALLVSATSWPSAHPL